jgi:anti-sigma regulatory factor (Ser/Thr protein kinase)
MSQSVVEVRFRHTSRPAAIGRARREVEDALDAAAVDIRSCGDVMLLVSELVTNAVRHASGEQFEVRVEVGRDVVRLEVHDDGAGFEPRIAPSDDGTGGYGLFIVDRLADRWGVERAPGGVIWVELDRPDA